MAKPALTAKQELATVRKALHGLTEELQRLGAENARLRLEHGPRCQHPAGTFDERNQQIMRRVARVAKLLVKYRTEREQFATQQEAFFRERQAWHEGFVKREREEWKRVWADMELWLNQQGDDDPAEFYRERKREIESGIEQGAKRAKVTRRQGGKAGSAPAEPARAVPTW